MGTSRRRWPRSRCALWSVAAAASLAQNLRPHRPVGMPAAATKSCGAKSASRARGRSDTQGLQAVRRPPGGRRQAASRTSLRFHNADKGKTYAKPVWRGLAIVHECGQISVIDLDRRRAQPERVERGPDSIGGDTALGSPPIPSRFLGPRRRHARPLTPTHGAAIMPRSGRQSWAKKGLARASCERRTAVS
jgi:hypothetical protein